MRTARLRRLLPCTTPQKVVAVALLLAGPSFSPAASAAAMVNPGPAAVAAQHGTGARVSGLRVAPHSAFPARAAALPDSVDLSAWAVPVGNQGSVGSCVSWAISYAMNGWYSRYQGVSSSGIAFAPMYSYSQIHVNNTADGGGSYPSAAYNIGSTQGVDTQAHYTHGNFDFMTLPTADERANAANYKTGPYSLLYSGHPGAGAEGAIENALATNHPVALTLPIYAAFDQLTAAAHTLDASQVQLSTFRGNHEVLIVGYDSAGVRIQNSWGPYWGDRGYANLSWNFIEQYSLEATTMTGLLPGSPTVPAAPTGLVVTTDPVLLSAALSWQAPTSSTPVTGYDLTVRGAEDSSTSTLHTGPSTSFTVTGLKAGVHYTLTVAADNAAGVGPTATATAYILGGPQPPRIGTAASGTAGAPLTATAAWLPPLINGGYPVSGYIVRASLVGGTKTVTSPALPATARSYKMTLPSGKWTFRVTARNSYSGSAQSAPSNAVAAR